MTAQLCLWTAPSAATTKGLVTVDAKLESCKEKADSLYEAFKMSPKAVADVRAVVEDHKILLDATSTRMIVLRDCRNEANASTTLSRKKLLQVQKNLAPASNNMNAKLERVVVVAKDQDNFATKCEETHSKDEQPEGFANKDMAFLNAKVVRVSRDRNASVAKAKQSSFELQSVSGLAEAAKKLRELLSALEAAARLKVTIVGKSLAKWLKRKKADVETKAEQTLVELDGRNARVTDTEARVQKLQNN